MKLNLVPLSSCLNSPPFLKPKCVIHIVYSYFDELCCLSGTLSEPHLEASVFIKDDDSQFPSTQFTFYSIQNHPELIDKFIKLTNLDPKVGSSTADLLDTVT